MNKNILIIWMIVWFLLMPMAARAAFVTCSGLDCTINKLLEVPVNIFNYLLGGAAIVLLAVIIWAGTRMMLYYLSESPESELQNAKLTLSRGIVGFLIIACSYLIVNVLAVGILGLNSASAVGKILKSFGLIK